MDILGTVPLYLRALWPEISPGNIASKCFGITVLVALHSLPHLAAGEVAVPGVLVKLIDQAEIPALEPGVLLSVSTSEGARVEQGELLGRIDDTEAQLALSRAKVELAIARRNAAGDSAVRAAEKTLKVAQLEWQRAQESIARFPDAFTRTELDRLMLAADQAALTLEQAQQEHAVAALTQDLKQVEVEFAARNLQRRQIVAPFSGVVVQLDARRGEWVEPGQKLLRIVRLDRLRVEGFLDANAASAVRQGSNVRLSVELPGRSGATFVGKLVFVSPEIDAVNGQVRIAAEIDNPDFALRPGLKGSLAVESSTLPR